MQDFSFSRYRFFPEKKFIIKTIIEHDNLISDLKFSEEKRRHSPNKVSVVFFFASRGDESDVGIADELKKIFNMSGKSETLSRGYGHCILEFFSLKLLRQCRGDSERCRNESRRRNDKHCRQPRATSAQSS